MFGESAAVYLHFKHIVEDRINRLVIFLDKRCNFFRTMINSSLVINRADPGFSLGGGHKHTIL